MVGETATKLHLSAHEREGFGFTHQLQRCGISEEDSMLIGSVFALQLSEVEVGFVDNVHIHISHSEKLRPSPPVMGGGGRVKFPECCG